MRISRVGVIGAGTMGRGIAQLAALGGYETVLYDIAPELVEAGAEGLRAALDKGAERGRWSVDEAKDAAARVETATELGGLRGCGLVVEAAPDKPAKAPRARSPAPTRRTAASTWTSTRRRSTARRTRRPTSRSAASSPTARTRSGAA